MILAHAINGGIVECDDETGKKLIESTMWVKYTAPAKKATSSDRGPKADPEPVEAAATDAAK
jgi:hypothetical protein